MSRKRDKHSGSLYLQIRITYYRHVYYRNSERSKVIHYLIRKLFYKIKVNLSQIQHDIQADLKEWMFLQE